MRNIALLIGLFLAGALLDPAIIGPVGPLAAPAERIGDRFARCGTAGSRFACVVDGDTLRLGDRRVRIIGIDTPDLAQPLCADEARRAGLAADRLVVLLNQGPFNMTAHRFHGSDRYGRDLRVLTRGNVDIGRTLVSEGHAHRYWGLKTDWC